MCKIKCVVACHSSSGTPELIPTIVECNVEEYHNGDHYEMAKIYAKEQGYEFPMVVFDECDGSKWIFDKLFSDTTKVILNV